MEQIEFPYQDCQPMKKVTDAQLLEELKIENCHLDLDICGTAEKAFLVSTPGSSEAYRYTVYLSDECIIAPMALFHPELLELSRAPKENGIRYMGKNQGDSEDPHDNIYLSETSRKYTKVNMTFLIKESHVNVIYVHVLIIEKIPRTVETIFLFLSRISRESFYFYTRAHLFKSFRI